MVTKDKFVSAGMAPEAHGKILGSETSNVIGTMYPNSSLKCNL